MTGIAPSHSLRQGFALQLQPLHRFPDYPCICLLEAPNRWDMRGKQERVLVQCRLHKGLTAAIVGVTIIPLEHPPGMRYFDGMVIQIAQEVERLFTNLEANNLMSRALTRCRNDLHAVAQLMISHDQIEQPLALYDG